MEKQASPVKRQDSLLKRQAIPVERQVSPVERQVSRQFEPEPSASKDPKKLVNLSRRVQEQKNSPQKENEEFRERMRAFMNSSTLSKKSRNSRRSSRRASKLQDQNNSQNNSQIRDRQIPMDADKSFDGSIKPITKSGLPPVSPSSASNKRNEKPNVLKNDSLGLSERPTEQKDHPKSTWLRAGSALLEVPSVVEVVPRSKLQERRGLQDDLTVLRGSTLESCERRDLIESVQTKDKGKLLRTAQIPKHSESEQFPKSEPRKEDLKGDLGVDNSSKLDPHSISEEINLNKLRENKGATLTLFKTETVKNQFNNEDSDEQSIASVFQSLSNE